MKVGPTSIDLPLTGTLVTVPANAIPAGTFRELELRVSSVHLKGTFDTKAFDVTLPVECARGNRVRDSARRHQWNSDVDYDQCPCEHVARER